MLDIKVVRVDGKNGFATCSFENHEIIIQMAREGYSFKGWVPAKVEGYGNITKIDLIFER